MQEYLLDRTSCSILSVLESGGLIGVIVLGVLHVGFGRLMIALGRYYRSDDYSVVLAEINHPVIYRILDIALIITCFLFGFVMTAGAGANLNQ